METRKYQTKNRRGKYETKKVKRNRLKNYFLVGVVILSSLSGLAIYKSIKWEPAYAHEYTQKIVRKELPMRDWILNEVEKAGLDKWFADDVIQYESKWDKNFQLINVNKNPGKCSKSTDRGVWALNSCWHPEISPQCAYEYHCATREAIRIIKKSGWNQWTGVNQGIIK